MPSLRDATTGQILMDVEHHLEELFGHRVGGFITLEQSQHRIDIRRDAGEASPYVDPVHKAKLERFGHWYRLRGEGLKPDDAALINYERDLLSAEAANQDRGWEAYETQEKLEFYNGPVVSMSWPQLQRRSDYLESIGYTDDALGGRPLLAKQIAYTRITQHVARAAAKTLPELGSLDVDVVQGLKVFRRELLTPPVVSFSSLDLSPQWQVFIQRASNALFSEVVTKVDAFASNKIGGLSHGLSSKGHAIAVVDVDRLKDPTFINKVANDFTRETSFFNPTWPRESVDELLSNDLTAERAQLEFAILEKMDRVHAWQKKYMTDDRFDMTLVQLANCESEMELARTELEGSTYAFSAELDRQIGGRERVATGPELGLEIGRSAES